MKRKWKINSQAFGLIDFLKISWLYFFFKIYYFLCIDIHFIINNKLLNFVLFVPNKCRQHARVQFFVTLEKMFGRSKFKKVALKKMEIK